MPVSCLWAPRAREPRGHRQLAERDQHERRGDRERSEYERLRGATQDVPESAPRLSPFDDYDRKEPERPHKRLHESDPHRREVDEGVLHE